MHPRRTKVKLQSVHTLGGASGTVRGTGQELWGSLAAHPTCASSLSSLTFRNSERLTVTAVFGALPLVLLLPCSPLPPCVLAAGVQLLLCAVCLRPTACSFLVVVSWAFSVAQAHEVLMCPACVLAAAALFL